MRALFLLAFLPAIAFSQEFVGRSKSYILRHVEPGYIRKDTIINDTLVMKFLSRPVEQMYFLNEKKVCEKYITIYPEEEFDALVSFFSNVTKVEVRGNTATWIDRMYLPYMQYVVTKTGGKCYMVVKRRRHIL